MATAVLVCGWEGDRRIWGRFAELMGERYEVRWWDLREAESWPGSVEVAVAGRGGEDAAVEMVRAGRAGRAVLVLPEALERGSGSVAAMEEFFPMMASGDFPDAERRRMVEKLTAHLEPLLSAEALELVREVNLDVVAVGLARGAAFRDGGEEAATPTRESWLDAGAAVGERMTVLVRAATPLAPRLPGVQVKELPTRSEYPWLEDPDAVVAAIG